MSPMIASASENKPPAPSPWKARKPASIGIWEVANVHRIEPNRKITMAAVKNLLRP